MSKVADKIKKTVGKKTAKTEAIEKIKETIAIKEIPEVKKDEIKSKEIAKIKSLFFTYEDLKESTKLWLKEVKENDSKIACRIGYAFENNESCTMADITRECGDSCYSAFNRLVEAGVAYKIPSGRSYKMGFKTKLTEKDKTCLSILQPKAVLDANAKINARQAKAVAEIRKVK